jgi:uncharacterized protein
MDNASKPIPVPNEDSADFWRGCKEHKLVLQRCQSCGSARFYPRIICVHCGSTETELFEASGLGSVFSYTVVHRAPSPAFRGDVPYVLAIVELEEGVRMMTNVIDCDPQSVTIDMPVRVEFERVSDEISLPKFVPANRSA